MECLDDTTKCWHEPRLRTIRQGHRAVYLQCLTCGQFTGNALPRALHPDVPDADMDLNNEGKLVQQIKEQKRHQDFLDNRDSRKEIYQEYLQSAKWKSLRARALSRDCHTCRGCMREPATEVHHLTYNNVGNELLFQLVSLCKGCHAIAHDDKNRKGLGWQ